MLHDQHQPLDRHTIAVNLARRYTVQNENDLMQEDIYDNTMDIAPKVIDRTYCENIAKNMMHAKDLPVECQTKYSDIVHELKRRDTDTTHPTQFLS